VVRQAVLAVWAVSAVLAQTDHGGGAVVDAVALDAVRGVAVALTPNQQQCLKFHLKLIFNEVNQEALINSDTKHD